MQIQHNMSAMNANRLLGINTTAQSKSTEKLSSGYRINRAADDAAGLAISEKMRGQIRGLNRASDNAQDGISLIQTAEGALNETHDILQRMRELAVQAANDTATDDDRTQIQNEIDQLTQEVDRIANTTEFNTKKLLDGSRTGSVNEKAGTVKTEGSFGNSLVNASVTVDGSAKAGFTDVIRLEVTTDFTKGQSTAVEEELSEKAITDIYSVLKNGGGTLTSDEFKSDMTTLSNTQAGTKIDPTTANANSLGEAIAAALTAEKVELTTMTASANKAASAVNKNEDSVAALMKGLEKYDAAVKAANESKEADKTGILAKGVTVDDVKKAFDEYVALLVEDGIVTSNKSTATSNAITAAEAKLTSLFYAGTDTAKAATATTAGDFVNLTTGTKQPLYKVDDTDSGLTNKDTLIADSQKTIKTEYADTMLVVVKEAAKQVAGTKVEAAKYAKDVEKQQRLIDTLSNTELTTAIYNYKKAEADLTSTKRTTGVTADAVAEATEKVANAKAALDKLNTKSSPLNVTDLFGNSASADTFKIAAKVDDDNNLTINLKNKSGDDTVITIANADKLKAGDTLTISTQEMVESKPAAVGKDALRLQIGANTGQEMSLGINSMKAVDLNIVQTKEGVEGKALDVTNQASAAMAIEAYDMAIRQVSTERAKMGAVQNRLEHTINNLDTAAENTQASESRIRDVDMASEMVEYSKNNILQQAAQSMLAQANQSTQGVLSLLQ